MRVTRIVSTTVAALTATVACLAMAAPASALKVKYNAVNSTANPDAVTTVDAPCPDGFSITGGGAFSSGDFEETMIQDSYPIDGKDADSKPDDAWRATIWNTSSQFRNIEAQAICAKAKTKYVTSILPNGNGGKRAKCPNGTSATGGGINVNESFAFPYTLISSRPNRPDPTKWSIFILGPGMAATGVTVHAACLSDEDAKVKARQGLFDSPMDDQSGGDVFCKASEKLVGVGADLPTQQGAVTSIFGADSPDDPNLTLDDGAMVTVDNQGDQDLDAEAHAVCARNRK